MLLAGFEAVAGVKLKDLSLGADRKDWSRVVAVKRTDLGID